MKTLLFWIIEVLNKIFGKKPTKNTEIKLERMDEVRSYSVYTVYCKGKMDKLKDNKFIAKGQLFQNTHCICSKLYLGCDVSRAKWGVCGSSLSLCMHIFHMYRQMIYVTFEIHIPAGTSTNQ